MARNTGELPVQVWGFNINDLPCEGYGFKVLNCEGFQLAPNGSHKVDIAFTPDFTLSKIQQRLVIHTSLGLIEGADEGTVWVNKEEPGRVEYSLVATVPTHLLAECGAAVPRPTWEPLLYYVVIPVMVAMLVGAIVLSIFEADHILKTTIIAMTTSLPSNGYTSGFDKNKVFDLRTIGHGDTKNMMSMKNGYANGHTHIENVKANGPLNSNKDMIANGRKPCSVSNNKKVGNSQITNSSTKSKYLKQSDSKSCNSVGDTFSGISDNPAIQNQSKNNKGKGNNKGNNKGSESMSWKSFFQRAVGGKKQDSTDTCDVSQNKKLSHNSTKDDSAVQKQSVGTETDLHIVETYPKLRKRAKQNNEEETSSTTTESSNTDDLSISERVSRLLFSVSNFSQCKVYLALCTKFNYSMFNVHIPENETCSKLVFENILQCFYLKII